MLDFPLENHVRAAQSGDKNAFGAIVERYKNLVFSVAFAVLRDAEAARDVSQTVFLAAWQRLPQMRSVASVPPWLRETARRQALQALRSQVREKHRRQTVQLSASVQADGALIAREEQRALAAALDHIPADAREVLLLFYSEEQSLAQVATLLEISEDAAKKRLQRAREALGEEVALAERVKRAVPGAAFVAALLAGLDAQANPPPLPRSAAWTAAASVAAVCVWAVLPSSPKVSAAFPPAAVIPQAAAASEWAAIKSAAVTPANAQEVECSTRDAEIKQLFFKRYTEPWLSEWQQLSVWFIDHCAQTWTFTPYLVMPPPRFAKRHTPDREMDTHWKAQLALHPASARVLGNAAEFYSLPDLAQAIQLLERAAALEPENAEWSRRLAQAHEFMSKRPGNEGTSQNAVGFYERALTSATTADDRARVLMPLARAALAANENALAQARARELLETSDGSDAQHWGHITLGHVAMRAGDTEGAQRELLLAAEVGGSRVLSSFGPDRSLLALIDDRTVAIHYLDRVARFWTYDHGCVDHWKRALAQNGTPAYDKTWECGR